EDGAGDWPLGAARRTGRRSADRSAGRGRYGLSSPGYRPAPPQFPRSPGPSAGAARPRPADSRVSRLMHARTARHSFGQNREVQRMKPSLVIQVVSVWAFAFLPVSAFATDAPAGAAYTPDRGPFQVQSVKRIVLEDAARKREVELRVSYPAGDGE